MAFLDKFKDKTHILSKQDVTGLLGNTRKSQQKSTNDLTSKTFSPSLPHKNLSQHYHTQKTSSTPQKKGAPQAKKQKVSPFHVTNPFYLDELEREKAERESLQRQARERIAQEKKKRMEIEAKLAESCKQDKTKKEKFIVKEWKPMGGLGPNHNEQWEKKTALHDKMLKFAKDIKKVNLEKLKSVPFMSISHVQNVQRHDSRTIAIQYSRRIPRPHIMAGERLLEGLQRSQSKEEISQLQTLEANHLKYRQMMRNM